MKLSDFLNNNQQNKIDLSKYFFKHKDEDFYYTVMFTGSEVNLVSVTDTVGWPLYVKPFKYNTWILTKDILFKLMDNESYAKSDEWVITPKIETDGYITGDTEKTQTLTEYFEKERYIDIKNLVFNNGHQDCKIIRLSKNVYALYSLTNGMGYNSINMNIDKFTVKLKEDNYRESGFLTVEEIKQLFEDVKMWKVREE